MTTTITPRIAPKYSVDVKALKAVQEGDLLCILNSEKDAFIFEVMGRDTKHGRYGHTTLSLKNLGDEDIVEINVTDTLPGNWEFVRRVSAGANSRTLEKEKTPALTVPSIIETVIVGDETPIFTKLSEPENDNNKESPITVDPFANILIDFEEKIDGSDRNEV